MGLVRIRLRADRIGQNSLRCKQDSLEFLREEAGVARIPLGIGGIWLEFLQEWVGFLQDQEELVRIPSEAGRIGQNSFGRICLGVDRCVRSYLGTGRISQNSFRSEWKWDLKKTCTPLGQVFFIPGIKNLVFYTW